LGYVGNFRAILYEDPLFNPHILYQEIHRLFLRIAPLDTYYKVH